MGEMKALDTFILQNVEKFETTRNLPAMRELAHLMCDIQQSMMYSANTSWESILSKTDLRYHVIGDTMKMLIDENLVEESLELSQRFKSVLFCKPIIKRYLEKDTSNKNIELCLQRYRDLSELIEPLKTAGLEYAKKHVQNIRYGGKMLLQSIQQLREEDDRTLFAKLGGTIYPNEIINALGVEGGKVGIVDVFVTHNCTIVHLLTREGDQVDIKAKIFDELSFESISEINKTWNESRLTFEFTDIQEKIIEKLRQLMSDYFCNELSQYLSNIPVHQIIFILDDYTRHLPFHISKISPNSIELPGRPSTTHNFFGSHFPIEYSICLQTIAISQWQKRPQNISKITSFADSHSDLPAACFTALHLSEQISKDIDYIPYTIYYIP